MALDDDAHDLPLRPPPPPTERAWRHPSELGRLQGPAGTPTSRPKGWLLLIATALVGTVIAVVLVGLVREVGGPEGAVTDQAGSGSVTTRWSRSAPRAAEAWLGVQGTDLGDAAAVMVTGVDGDSPAAAAGLQPGDTIIAVDDRPVATFAELEAAIATREVGEVVVLLVVRASVHLELRCVVGPRPSD